MHSQELHIKVDLDLFPEERDFVAKELMFCKNKTKVGIDSIFINYTIMKRN
jgi:ABC-2 type transport system permease protein